MLRKARTGRLLLATAMATLLVAPVAAATGSVADDDYPDGTTLRPTRIDRGEDTRLLHTEGKVIVDGATRVRVDHGRHMWVLGRSGRAYVVVTSDRDYRRWQVRRIDRDGDDRVVARGGRYVPDPKLSDDGRHVALVRVGNKETRVRVVDTRSGVLLRARTFRGYVDLEDYGTRRMVLSEWSSQRMRTFWWNPHNSRQTRIAGQPAYIADISSNRLGLMVSEIPESCQRVVRLSDPTATLWRSCHDRVFEFSPNGRRMLTGHILSDGPGPHLVQVRHGHGRLLATYRSEWFGFSAWENDRSLLLETAGKEYTAAVRCVPPAGCERASNVFRNPGRDPYFPPAMKWTFPH